MTEKTDFLHLYQQLGLRPDCSPEELKSAYRRRVAELHPDRPAVGRDDVEAAARLQELTAAYSAAANFRRRYGRLPGAQRASPHLAPESRWRPGAVTASRSTGLHRVALCGFALAALGWLAWQASIGDIAEEPAADAHVGAWVTVPPAPVAAQTTDPSIELGMDADTVRAIEGRPVMENNERWDYGPSWIEFDHGHVSDWYSSRLRPLRTARVRPHDSH